mmetsp:Transcript_27256/g.35025  ORF Transcript_27256/g.35025 Transcript_27256/m.35025 type:complete len:88 (+) Transcript_27256:931-1194(+)
MRLSHVRHHHHHHQVAPVSLKSISNVGRTDISHIEAVSNIGGSARSPEIAFDLVCRLLRDNASMQAKLEIARIPALTQIDLKEVRPM